MSLANWGQQKTRRRYRERVNKALGGGRDGLEQIHKEQLFIEILAIRFLEYRQKYRHNNST